MKKVLPVVFALCFTATINAVEFKKTKMAGWTVLSSPKVDKDALSTLESTLDQLNQIFPPKILAVIKRVPIQIEGNEDRAKDGKLESGRYEVTIERIDGVDHPKGMGKVRIYSSRDCGNKILLLHEFSHAAQYLTVGYNNERINEAYQDVAKQNLYPKDCYLMKNSREYFAEMSVVYLSKLHYFPHDRESLKKHDPISYKLMEDFWGEVASKEK